MPPLYLYIIPFTRIKSKIPQWQNQSAKLATTKHIIYTRLIMEKTHMHGRKECQNLIVKLSSAHSQVAKSLKAQLLQDAPFSKQKALPHCTRCSQTSQPLWNAVSIAVRPEWLVDPRTSTLEQVNDNIHMADCRSPIVSVRSQPLWHNVAIRSVFIVIMKRCTHLPFLAPFAILPRRHSN